MGIKGLDWRVRILEIGEKILGLLNGKGWSRARHKWMRGENILDEN